MFLLCATKIGTQTDELLQAGESGHKGDGKMLKRIKVLEEARVWKIERQKNKDYWKRVWKTEGRV